MTVDELIVKLNRMPKDLVVVCRDENGGWDNVEEVIEDGCTIAIIFGGGSPFSDE